MKVSIQYCVEWNYLPKAASLADAIKAKHGIETQLIRGSGGIFDVKADGKLIYSKFQTGRFPEHDEILAELEPLVT